MKLWDLPSTEEGAVAFLQAKDILPSTRICTNGHQMKLYFGKRITWCCNLRACRTKVNMRVGNWFERSRIPFLTALRFIFGWSEEMTTGEWCKQHLEISDHTVVDWNNYLREVCLSALLRRPSQIFGGICRETKQSFVQMVPDRTMSTITEAINNNIEEVSVLYSDSWRLYCTTALLLTIMCQSNKCIFIIIPNRINNL